MTASADLTLKQAGAALYAGQFAQALVWERFAQGLPPDHITVPPMS